MAEEVKQEEKKVESSKVLWRALKFLLAAIFFVVGILLTWNFRADLATVFKGCIGLFLILAGVITFAIAKE